MGVAFHERLRNGFLDIARQYPDRCVVISAMGSVDEVQERVRDAAEVRLGGKVWALPKPAKA